MTPILTLPRPSGKRYARAPVPQQHLDRLSAVDAAFLHQESPTTQMHIGGVILLEGPAPPFDDLREHVRSRLPLVPRYRQKLAAPPLGLGRQMWIDDPAFNLDYHLRHTALPRPGGDDALRRLVGRLFTQRLDRTKPLWELWVVEGLAGGRTALISKTHHALVDGIAGVDLATVLFDLDPEPHPIEPGDPWQPRPEPTGAELAAASLRNAARLPFRGLEALGRVPSELAEAREAIEGLGEVVWAGLNPPPDTPLNVRIGPHRRFEVAPARLEDLKQIKDAFGGTVNDAVLAVVAGALQRWFHARGLRTEGLELRACVPVSVRTADERGALGNRLTQLVAPLPIGVRDPVERLRLISEAMAGVKDSKQALGAQVIAGAQEFAPPTLLAQASRLNFSTRFFNLLVTNIPGPQVPLYVLGRKVEAVFPVPFLAGDRALAIAVMSYDGGMGFGLLGDLDAMADLVIVATGIEESLAELLALARGEEPPKPTPARRRSGKKAAAPTPAPLRFPSKPRAGGPAAARRAAVRKPRATTNGAPPKPKAPKGP
jgi:WS/DGAT/MGAT family acyltransferase